jgi:phosphoglycolate phosphatase-like HAD superfamily hydrolase
VPRVNNAIQIKLFWDIDGTVLRTNGAAAIPFADAVKNFTGSQVTIDRQELSGFTDYEIALHLMGISPEQENLQKVTEVLNFYTDHLSASLKVGKVEKIGEVEETFKLLRESPQVELAIGTGNCHKGALTKLSHVKLLRYFDLKNIFCASEENWNRDLVLLSAHKSLDHNQIGIVIGDSPKDILSAKSVGLRVIAVATGMHSEEALSRYSPNFILDHNWNYKNLNEAILKLTNSRAY